MIWRGANQDALRLLSEPSGTIDPPEELVQRLTLESVAFTHLQQFKAAELTLTQAERICSSTTNSACGTVPRARGVFALEQAHLSDARRYFLESLSFAKAHRDRLLETTVLSYIGVVSLQNEHYDEAVDWSRSAYQAAVDLGAEDMAQTASGNLGWAYFELGDAEKSLQLFLEAEKRARDLGDPYLQLNWLITTGDVYQTIGDLTRASQFYRQALDMARQMNSKEDIVTSLVLLAYVSIDLGKLDEASASIEQVIPLVQANGNRLDALDVMLAQGRIAAARRQHQQAEASFRAVERDPDSQTSMRLGSEHELAKLFELEGNSDAADRMYKTALTTFESSRAQIKNETSQLPFLANATRIYDDYIHFLVKQGKQEEALAAADQSRARTLAQDLGGTAGKTAFRPSVLNPRQVAQKTGATLLFYWLGAQQSYLWVVTPAKTVLLPLPAESEIVARVKRYRRALLDVEDPLASANEDGQALYHLLVAPAAKLIRPDAPVMILADGELSQLNFETLLVPGRSPALIPGSVLAPAPSPAVRTRSAPDLHYWIDDATVMSAPSLAMLAAAKPTHDADRNLLLLGDPISPNKDFPSLPLFGVEMTQVERHFAAHHAMVFAGSKASPSAYLDSNPAQFAYIHFVAHAFASRADPLDSAVILSGGGAGEDSFKLYARDIMRRPINAQLVTISACNGSGARSYAGEGLVGLSWAFLRAGAHSVIGALWEATDDSTPRLMDTLYQGLEDGQTPASALRRAKLTVLHAPGKFRRPYYWAPFQIYTRQ
jgi:CHAT domain-containing protein